jgi:hypothetical protein
MIYGWRTKIDEPDKALLEECRQLRYESMSARGCGPLRAPRVRKPLPRLDQEVRPLR